MCAPSPQQKKKIAVIDDDGLVRRSVTRMLQMSGYEVTAFPDAAPALEECDFENMDLILTDLMMPTDGVDLITALRDQGIQIPIVVMSGSLEKRTGFGDSLKSIGAQATLPKPFSIDELLDVIGELVDK